MLTNHEERGKVYMSTGLHNYNYYVYVSRSSVHVIGQEFTLAVGLLCMEILKSHTSTL